MYRMKNKEQILTAIATTILSSEKWKSSKVIADELRSQGYDLNPQQVQRLLFRQPNVVSRQQFGYRLPFVDPIDTAILRSLKKGKTNISSIAKEFGISRAAIHKRKEKLSNKSINA